MREADYKNTLASALDHAERALGLQKPYKLNDTYADLDMIKVYTDVIKALDLKSSADKRVIREELEPAFEKLSYLSFQVGFTKSCIIEMAMLDPIDEVVKMLSVFATINVLGSNRDHIGDVIKYMITHLQNADKKSMQNKYGGCYRILRIFVFCTFIEYSLGCSIISNFILTNINSIGGRN